MTRSHFFNRRAKPAMLHVPNKESAILTLCQYKPSDLIPFKDCYHSVYSESCTGSVSCYMYVRHVSLLLSQSFSECEDSNYSEFDDQVSEVFKGRVTLLEFFNHIEMTHKSKTLIFNCYLVKGWPLVFGMAFYSYCKVQLNLFIYSFPSVWPSCFRRDRAGRWQPDNQT